MRVICRLFGHRFHQPEGLFTSKHCRRCGMPRHLYLWGSGADD